MNIKNLFYDWCVSFISLFCLHNIDSTTKIRETSTRNRNEINRRLTCQTTTTIYRFIIYQKRGKKKASEYILFSDRHLHRSFFVDDEWNVSEGHSSSRRRCLNILSSLTLTLALSGNSISNGWWRFGWHCCFAVAVIEHNNIKVNWIDGKTCWKINVISVL